MTVTVACVTVICDFFFIFLNQQFIIWHIVADHGSYFITTYKRNRLTRELKLKKEKERGKRTNQEGEGRK